MDATLAGIVMDDSEWHSENTELPIAVTLDGMVKPSRETQSEKVLVPRAVTRQGEANETVARVESPRKTLSPMAVTVFGIVISGRS